MRWAALGERPKVFSTACVLTLVQGMPSSAAPSFLARDALWTVVRTCESAKASVGLSLPCLDVRDSPDGYRVALLRPPFPRTHLLVVPLARMPGIESPELRGRAGGAYLAMAWDARNIARGDLGPIPWASAGMAINSAGNRSQDQLHVHVDCLTQQAKSNLTRAGGSVGKEWKVLWRGVWARLVRGEDLRAADPLGPMIERLPLGPIGRSGLNFGVAGVEWSRGQKGYILLASKTMSFERLLDSGCALLQPGRRS
jgi:CDP-diacylglycerol pyrophosphatase